MNKTSIEWVKNPDGSQGYTWNPITGCLNHENGLCKGGGFPCYAFKLAHGRLKQRYYSNPIVAPRFEDDGTRYNRYEDLHDPFFPRFWEERLTEPLSCLKDELSYYPQQPKGIFVCDMGELFGDWIPLKWQEEVFEVIRACTRSKNILNHRFYLLTKQPQKLIRFSPFPANCYIGVTVTGHNSFWRALSYLKDIKATVKFLSLEPLLEHIKLLPPPYSNFEPVNKPVSSEALRLAGISWLIIGACTGSLEGIKRTNYIYKDTDGLMPLPYGKKWTLQPKIEWVEELVEAADEAGISVFLKDNLEPLFEPYYELEYPWAYRWSSLRQEMPWEVE